MKKVFCIAMFGSPFPWIQQYIDGVQHLEKYGWYWKIFTPHELKSKGNVEIVPMTIEEFNRLVHKTCGIDPENAIVEGRPTKPMTDYYVASGVIFADWLKDADYWGITNMDVVYGRLDHFVSDSLLKEYHVYTDDPSSINGVFSLYRNSDYINHLFQEIPNWQEAFTSTEIVGTDEYGMTEVVKKKTCTVYYPKYYPIHSHDRLENHVPKAKLELKEDGSLWELLMDIDPPKWEHARPFIGREIPYFHFQRTKTWPL